ncbi:MAG TPA: BadF/BadG/BcrA/BcrD ATPase family protein [Ignavibacteriales bacterium]|nr:BadF/BadG/BcrA/BcrD ATPase family protein [Ignavibacteriales bacterium]
MQYFIGMDGGGTKTACVLVDTNLKALHKCAGGASNFLIIGTDTVSRHLSNLINECLSSAKIKADEISGIVLGTTGAGRRNDAEKMENDFTEFAKTSGLGTLSFRVESDARVALEGAFAGRPGSILIAGTGSIMFGKDVKGEIHRVGGFGRFIGDEGSGYSIGRKGLKELAKSYDGRGATTLLSKLASAKFELTSPESIINAVYKNNFDIASIAPLVIEAAEKNDDVCLNILNEECMELMLHITAMKKKINTDILNISLIGGIVSSDNFFSRIFNKRVSENFPFAKIKLPEFPPEIGAAIMAKSQFLK